jgi:hypothetical protein
VRDDVMMMNVFTTSSNNNKRLSYAYVIYITSNKSRTLSINDIEWIIDSGCSEHACNNIAAFSNMTNKRTSITIADGTEIYSSGKGSVGDFHNVNYVPEFKNNLLSVKQLTMQGYDVVFTTDGSVIINSDDKSQQLGQYKHGVYVTQQNACFNSEIIRDQTSRYQVPAAEASDLIHQRWGHAFIKRIIDAQTHGLVKGFHSTVKAIKFCDACAKAKLHKTPSTHTLHTESDEPKILKRLSRVSCDISGIIHTTGIQGVQYFVLFICQATHYMWIMFVKDVTDESLIDAFDKFYLKVLSAQEELNEMHIMKAFKTDCATCFTSEKFITHLNERGVRVEFSAPNSHHQNGIAERAIRTLREMGMCQMIHAKVPNYLWPYAFRHAVYINNRLPTSILGKHTTSYIEMFHHTPDERHTKYSGVMHMH